MDQRHKRNREEAGMDLYTMRKNATQEKELELLSQSIHTFIEGWNMLTNGLALELVPTEQRNRYSLSSNGKTPYYTIGHDKRHQILFEIWYHNVGQGSPVLWNAKFTLQTGPHCPDRYWDFFVPYKGNSEQFTHLMHAAVKRVLKAWVHDELTLLWRELAREDHLKTPERISMMVDDLMKTHFFKREQLSAISDQLTRLGDDETVDHDLVMAVYHLAEELRSSDERD